MALGITVLHSSCLPSCFVPRSGVGQGTCRGGQKGVEAPPPHSLSVLWGCPGSAWRWPCSPQLLGQGQDHVSCSPSLSHTICLLCCLRVPRSSVPSVTPSHLPETFGASTYEGPSGRAGCSYSAQLITPRGRRTTATTIKTKTF